jgi:hypothetical protein
MATSVYGPRHTRDPPTIWYHYWYHQLVTKHDKRLTQMRNSPTNVSFDDLASVCEHYFGEPRQRGSSHHVYKTPWPGDPRVNIQNSKGQAKAYQVRQVLEAIDKLEDMSSTEEEQ